MTPIPSVITIALYKACVCRAKLWCGALWSRFGAMMALRCGRKRRPACVLPSGVQITNALHIHASHGVEKLKWGAQSARNAVLLQPQTHGTRNRFLRAYACVCALTSSRLVCVFAVDGHRVIRDDGVGKFPTTALKTKEFMRLTALSGTIFTG